MDYVKKFLEYTLDNPQLSNEFDDLYSYAKSKHDATGAIRKHSKQPYMVHPLDCAQICRSYGGNSNEISAAIAHDLIEDTDVTFDDIESLFGEDIASIVLEVTNDNEEISKIGKESYINKKLCSLSKEAFFVKLCDFYSNSLDYPKEEQRKRMLKNIEYVVRHRKIDSREEELIDSIYTALAA